MIKRCAAVRQTGGASRPRQAQPPTQTKQNDTKPSKTDPANRMVSACCEARAIRRKGCPRLAPCRSEGVNAGEKDLTPYHATRSPRNFLHTTHPPVHPRFPCGWRKQKGNRDERVRFQLV